MGYDQLRLTPGAWLDLLGPLDRRRLEEMVPRASKVDLASQLYALKVRARRYVQLHSTAAAPPRPQQIQPGARGKSQLIVTHLDVHPPRSIVPGHSLGIGILKISPVTPRTTLLPYDTRPIKGSVRLILRPRCRLSLRSRGAPTPIFPPKQTSTIGRGGVLYLSYIINSRPRSGIPIKPPEGSRSDNQPRSEVPTFSRTPRKHIDISLGFPR